MQKTSTFFALSVKSYCKAERKSFLNYFTNWTLGNAAWQAFASCTTARQPSFWWGWVVAQSCPALGPISAGGTTSWPCWPWTPVSICKILILHHFESQFKSVMTFLLTSCFFESAQSKPADHFKTNNSLSSSNQFHKTIGNQCFSTDFHISKKISVSSMNCKTRC